ncbi:hypothetical protein HDU93_002552 [Gonapodya sp. JEL0774]|nr:hypothetical protein HDU93_002552 [Gonapodya sp. JEL0774]
MRVLKLDHPSTTAQGKLNHSRLRVLTVRIFDRCNIMNVISASHPEVGVTPCSSPPRYYIPFSRNKQFVGRDHVLATLNRKLFDNKDCQRAALVGLGGVGKTQVALEFAYRVKDTYQDYSIFWFPALSMESFEQACKEVAMKVGVSQTTGATEDIKEVVKRYLSKEAAGKWLLIIDNADDADVVGTYLAGVDTINMQAMSDEEAAEFFRKSLTRTELLGDQLNTSNLLKDLTNLPVAIAQAAAYLNINSITIKRYRELLEEDMTELLSEDFCDQTRYEESHNSVAKTWVVSFKQIRRENPLSEDILAFMACIEWKSIPRTILPTAGGAVKIEGAIGTLIGYAFVSRRSEEINREDEVYDLHRLVHLAAWHWLCTQRLASKKMEEAITHIRRIFPTNEWENRERWREYLPHAVKVLGSDEGNGVELKYDLCLLVGRCLNSDGRFAEAALWLQTCVSGRQQLSVVLTGRKLEGDERKPWEGWLALLDETFKRLRYPAPTQDNIPLLEAQQELAHAYEYSGQVDKAVNMLELVVAARERVLLEDHPDLLAARHALARAYFSQGQLERAKALLKSVHHIREKKLPEDDPARILSANDLETWRFLNVRTSKAAGAGALSKALQDIANHETELNLQWKSVGDAGTSAIAHALKTNSALRTIKLAWNSIGEVGARALAEALKTNSALKSLNMAFNSIRDAGARALAEALKTNSTLTSLNLCDNSIGDAGARALAEALKTNSTLTSLNLCDNSISDAGAGALGEALKTNSTLTSLHVSDNSIGEAGRRAIKALANSRRTIEV